MKIIPTYITEICNKRAQIICYIQKIYLGIDKSEDRRRYTGKVHDMINDIFGMTRWRVLEIPPTALEYFTGNTKSWIDITMSDLDNLFEQIKTIK